MAAPLLTQGGGDNNLFKISSEFSTHILHKIKGSTTSDDIENETSAIELDSHADSPVVGKHSQILHRTGRRVKVSGFTDQLGDPIPVDVVDAAMIYDCEYSGKSYIMIIRNALYLKQMETTLIPPFMMRVAGIEIDECPKFLARDPSIKNHSIYFPEDEIRIPMKLYGIISYIPARLPSTEELEGDIESLELTPQTDHWDPHDECYQQQEDSMMNYKGELKEKPIRKFIVSQTLISRATDQVANCTDLTRRACEGGFSQHKIFAIKTAEDRKSTLNPSDLAEVWGIGLETARRTIKVTTRLCVRDNENITLNRRYAVNDRMLRYKHIMTPIFMDTMYASRKAGKSYRGFSCVQVFASEFGWMRVHLMRSEKEIHLSLKALFKDVGVPHPLIADGARAQIEGKARLLCEDAGCKTIELEKNTPASNRAERYIQVLKNGSKRDMIRANSPMILWDYCIERRAAIECVLAKDNYLLQGSTPHSMMTGEVTDISHLCRFNWYEWVKFRKPGELYPYPTEWLGRCLGPAVNKGNMMSQNILTEQGEILPIQTCRKLSESEWENPNEIEKRKKMDLFMMKRYGDAKSVPENWIRRRRRPGDPMQYDDENPTIERYEDEFNKENDPIPEMDDIPDLDLFMNSEVLLPQDGDHLRAGTVVGRIRDRDGNPVGDYNANPILNTRVYEVMFPDGSIQQYGANIIAENMYSQVDDEGHRYMLLDEIVDHRKKDTAIERDDGFVTDPHGRKSRILFLVNWKDGSQSWVSLKDMKESNPIEVAEYSKLREIDGEPAFA